MQVPSSSSRKQVAQAVAALAARVGVEMPITRAVCAVLFEGLPVADAVSQLLQRDARDE